jgi:hypothetical protein
MNVTRRDFLVAVPLAGGALVLLPALPSLLTKGETVLSFHLDQPYVDQTGLADPYVPPAGMRSAAPLAALSDMELSRYYGLI